jgi:predicted small secreted protein
MKKIIRLFTILMVSLFVLTGCSNLITTKFIIKVIK